MQSKVELLNQAARKTQDHAYRHPSTHSIQGKRDRRSFATLTTILFHLPPNCFVVAMSPSSSKAGSVRLPVIPASDSTCLSYFGYKIAGSHGISSCEIAVSSSIFVHMVRMSCERSLVCAWRWLRVLYVRCGLCSWGEGEQNDEPLIGGCLGLVS